MNFEIGNKIRTYYGNGIILSFNKKLDCCIIEYDSNFLYGHIGDLEEYWYDKKGNKLPYIKGNNRRYETIASIKLITQTELNIFN